MLRKKALSKDERRQVIPRVGNPSQTEQGSAQGSWLVRAAKSRRQHGQRSHQTTIESDEKGKSAKAARRLGNTPQAAITATPERLEQLESSLTRTHGPSAMYNAARAWPRLEKGLHSTGASKPAPANLPTPETLRRFLDYHAKDGDTVPHNLYKGLTFCQAWLGVAINVDDCVLSSFRNS